MINCLKIMSFIITLINVSTLASNACSFCIDKDSIHEKDSVIIFRFIPENKKFYSPFKDNKYAISQTVRLIENHRKDIETGRAYLLIRGFCSSFSTYKENLAAAKERSNHVKSWFITHYGMIEDYYLTQNSANSYQGTQDITTLGINYIEVYNPEKEGHNKQHCATNKNKISNIPKKLKTFEKTYQKQTEIILPDSLKKTYNNKRWYLKTNMLYDCLIMPSLEIEYRIDKDWSVSLEGNIAWWHNENKNKYYQLATIIPEIRYWVRRKNNVQGHFAGLFGGIGWYDLENGYTGYKGEGGLIGLSYGYMFPLNKNLAFEASVGAGFMTTKYDKYIPIDRHYVYLQTNRYNYFGPLKIKFALVWNIGYSICKKGGRL